MPNARPYSQRPQEFVLDYQHWLWNGLLFCFLGRYPGSAKIIDHSQFNNQCSIANGASISADWVYDYDLKRWGYANVNAAPGISSSFIFCGNPPNINQIHSLSACGWVRAVDVTTGGIPLLSCQSGTQGFSLNANQTGSGTVGGALSIWAHDTTWQAVSYSAGITAGQLYHVGFTTNQSLNLTELLFNGKVVASGSIYPADVGNNALGIGANAVGSTTGSSGCNQQFFDWCIWSGYHPEKIREMYNIGRTDPMYGGAIIPISRAAATSAAATPAASKFIRPLFQGAAI